MVTVILLSVVLLWICGWASTIESAYIALNHGKLKLMSEAGDEKATQACVLMGNISKIFTSLRVVIVITMILIGMLAAEFFVNTFGSFLIETGLLENVAFLLYPITLVVITLIVSFFILVFAEMVPKRLGIKNSEKLVLGSVKKMKVLLKITFFFDILIISVSNSIVRLFGIDPKQLDSNITEEEIRMMVDAGGDNGSIDENEKDMINNIFEFDNISVGDIATHRTDIVALQIDATLEDVTDIVNDEKYSRIPVYEETIDNIVGIFHVKDFVKYILNKNESIKKDGFDLKEILMKPYFVPISKKTDELFAEMQKTKSHMAIVIDEYGGTAGIVTMEDIIEEIVGNIFDEYDVFEEEEICYLDKDNFIINGTTDLADVEDLLAITFENNEDYDTLGGYIIGQLGRIPDDDERLEVKINNLVFKIESMEEKRIEKIRVSKEE